MDWAVKMMQRVCKVFSTPVERNHFLQSVANAFACAIMEMLQSVMSGEYTHKWYTSVSKMHTSLPLRQI